MSSSRRRWGERNSQWEFTPARVSSLSIADMESLTDDLCLSGAEADLKIIAQGRAVPLQIYAQGQSACSGAEKARSTSVDGEERVKESGRGRQAQQSARLHEAGLPRSILTNEDRQGPQLQ